MLMRKQLQMFVAGFLATLAASVSATSIVDYTTIMSSVTTELTAGVVAAATGIGIIWGAKIAVRFVRSLLH